MYLPVVPLWGLNCTFCGSATASGFMCGKIRPRKQMFIYFPANLSAFLMCVGKKIKSKIIHNPQAFCSVSVDNAELVLSSSPKNPLHETLSSAFSCLQLRPAFRVQPLQAGICTRTFYGALHVQMK